MLTPAGPKVLEYNVRFGDPSARCWCRGSRVISSSSRESAAGDLVTTVELSDTACVGVVLAAEGYPPAPDRKGDVITGLDDAGATTACRLPCRLREQRERPGRDQRRPRPDGHGRRRRHRAARDRAYAAAAEISWPGVHYRHDIGSQALS